MTSPSAEESDPSHSHEDSEETPTQEERKQARNKLLDINNKILLIKSYIQVAKKKDALGYASICVGLLGVTLHGVDYFVIQWQGIPPYVKHIVGGFFVALTSWGVYLKLTPGVLLKRLPEDLKEEFKLNINHPRRTTAQLELELQLLRENKRIQSDSLQLSIEERRAAYREDALVYVEELRRESNLYRKVSHVFQGVVIAGSALGGIGAGTTYFVNDFSILVAVTNGLVATASGFSGYFKYKERGFYAQQTADAIEHELEAYELGVGRYKNSHENTRNLLMFAEEIHRLRQDQKMREQNLNQPSSSKGEESN